VPLAGLRRSLRKRTQLPLPVAHGGGWPSQAWVPALAPGRLVRRPSTQVGSVQREGTIGLACPILTRRGSRANARGPGVAHDVRKQR